MSPYWTAQTQIGTNIINKVPEMTKVGQFIIIVKPRVTQAKHFTAMQPKTLSCQLDMVRKVPKQTTMAAHQIKIAKAVINYAPTSATAQLKDFTFKACQKDGAFSAIIALQKHFTTQKETQKEFQVVHIKYHYFHVSKWPRSRLVLVLQASRTQKLETTLLTHSHHTQCGLYLPLYSQMKKKTRNIHHFNL